MEEERVIKSNVDKVERTKNDIMEIVNGIEDMDILKSIYWFSRTSRNIEIKKSKSD